MRLFSAALVISLFVAGSLTAQSSEKGDSASRLGRISNTFHPANALAASAVESVTLSIYRDELGGDPIWTETQNVDVQPDARYSILGPSNGAGWESSSIGPEKWSSRACF